MYGEPSVLYGPDASILITGASSGIGAAIARRLASYGGKIALVARRADRLEALATEVRDRGATATVLVCDVTDQEAVARTDQQLRQHQGPATVAFLNAGMGDTMAASRFRSEMVRRIFNVNLFGVTNWLEHLLPAMIERGHGVIAGMSSLAAHRGLPKSGPYCASKAALSTLLEALRVELRDTGIRISTIEPGFVRSELTAKNDFAMPFLVETEDAAVRIVDDLAAGKAVIRFPWQLAAAISVLRAMPGPIYDRVASSMDREKRDS